LLAFSESYIRSLMCCAVTFPACGGCVGVVNYVRALCSEWP